MGKLAEAAGAEHGLTGKVCVTDENGFTTTYEDEAAAESALPKGAQVEHRRGAFFLKPMSRRRVKERTKPSEESE